MTDRPMDDFKPAEAFPLGEFLRDELVARGWTVASFAEKALLSLGQAQGLLTGEYRLGQSTARVLAKAMGVSAMTLLGLQASYERWCEV